MPRKKNAVPAFRDQHPDLYRTAQDILEARKSLDNLTASFALLVQNMQDETGAAGTAQEEYLTAPQVAKMLGLTNQGVYGMVCRKAIPYCKIGGRVRFVAADIDRWMKGRGNYEQEGI
jgi:excisionase family DNA binding protein